MLVYYVLLTFLLALIFLVFAPGYVNPVFNEVSAFNVIGTQSEDNLSGGVEDLIRC